MPLSVLRAITRTETGRARAGVLQPWPWTVNMEGTGKWFENESDARAYVQKHFDRGARSFDVGCFQINYRWHGQAFESIDQMFDPLANARYAADFLKRLYSETGDWSKAAGAYHSRTPLYANKYTARFDRIRAKLSNAPLVTVTAAVREVGRSAPAPTIRRANTYPLLQVAQESTGAAKGGLGSLVPLGGTSRPALVAFSPDNTGG